jgi:hypothetical protein
MLRNNIAPSYTGYKIEKATQLELRSVCELIHMYDKMLQPESIWSIKVWKYTITSQRCFLSPK